VVTEIRGLVGKGYREIVLTGVDMTAYGRDLPGGMSLGKLVRKILKLVPELERLRLSSIDQVEADEALLAALAEEPRLMPHLHLSMQSGDDMILKRMKRRHQSADAIRFCEEVRRLRPDVVLGADLIAGFPTESEEMFRNTERIVEACGLTYLHVFPFSPREGTPAARMPQVERSIIKERAERLRWQGEQMLGSFLASQSGRVVSALVEQNGLGRTPQFAEIAIDSSLPVGDIAGALVTGHDGRRLIGEIVA
jgi:threonylcarbamoyladenosine tRNA methylthiotransferase MtaB